LGKRYSNIKTMTVEQQGKHKRAVLIPVKGRPGVFTYDQGELHVDRGIVIRGLLLQAQNEFEILKTDPSK